MRPYTGTGKESQRATVALLRCCSPLFVLPKGEYVLHKKVYDGACFQGFPETQRITGLSRGALQRGLDAGIFPHIKSGTRTLFNVPALLEVLEEMSTGDKEGVQH